MAVRRLRHRDGKSAVHAVGGVSGLLLVCKPPPAGQDIGARSWILRVKVGDKRRDIGLGGYPDVTLSQARERAREVKDKIRKGVDPVSERKALKSALIAEQAKAVTFSDLADEYIKKKSREFKSLKQTYKLTQQLETYAYPHIGRFMVADIDRAHIVKMLQADDLWTAKHETAGRVRLHVERVLDLAGVKGLRTGDNPARWKGNLDLSLPAAHKVANRKNHNALPVGDMPDFWRKLLLEDKLGARVLQFTILTAARPGEARGALWDEIDMDRKLWIIPAVRMKGGKEHKVPLITGAVKLLESQPRQNEYVFPGPKGKPVSDVAVSKVPKLLGHDVTAHGFRSTFRTWVQEYTAYAEDVAELALAHVNSDATRAAYARSELIDKRRLLMADWERYCYHGEDTSHSGKVTSIGSKS
ncbi:MAG: integrase arm-type DNA-binding domain-containing protein [Pirellulales bacterium]